MSEIFERDRTVTPAGDDPGTDQLLADATGWRERSGHVIVCGLQTVGVRTVEQLHLAGASVVVLDDEAASARHVRVLGD